MTLRHFVPLSLVLGAAASASAQSQAVPPITLPTVVVTAQKEPADAQRLPVSVSAVSGVAIADAGFATVGEASVLSPNTRFAELSARKISNAFMRGIGSSPSNPGITTYIDGVPQLNSNSSSIELLDIEQVEYVRGPQSWLFGRNTLGGLVNVASARPSMQRWTGQVATPFGTQNAREVRTSASGPVGGGLALGFSYGHSERDGFTVNDVTGNLLDSRSADFGKAQMLWIPSPTWEARVIVSGETAHDGDYALNDLAEVRRNPFHAARDFEGETNREILSSAVLLRYEGRRVAFSSATGVVSWSTSDLTDLDYSPMPLMTRSNAEESRQITQEFRLASAAPGSRQRPRQVALTWQTGVFYFTQDYTQDAINSFSPQVLSPYIPYPVNQHSPQSALDDEGIGVYGQGTLTFGDAFDLSFGARYDRERKSAILSTFYDPPIAPPTLVDTERTYSDISPQAAVAYRAGTSAVMYFTAARGFKAGGFNAASPQGSEAYDEEFAWSYEGGLKTTWGDGRVWANTSIFRIDWDDMQLNVPNPYVPAQFYIANVGGARSSGVEFELNARATRGLDLQAAVGYTRASFRDGSMASGVDVSGNELPMTPGYTVSFGAQYSTNLGKGSRGYIRGDAQYTGAYHYDEANLEGQDAYWLANFRAGIRSRKFLAEAWVKNAFDTRYIPVAFAYAGLAPSGFLGESGRPRTYGFSLGVGF